MGTETHTGPTTVPMLLRLNRERCGDVRAIVAEDRTITHAQLDHESRAVAARLVAAGCGRSSRIGLLAPNGIEWVVTAAAVMRIGALLVPLSTLLRPPELLAQIRTADVSHLIAASEFRGRNHLAELDAEVPGLRALSGSGDRVIETPSIRAVWAIDELPRAEAHPDIVTALEDRVRPAHDLCVLFTSGSRGVPKGVIHTHGGALRATASGLRVRCVGDGEVLYLSLIHI